MHTNSNEPAPVENPQLIKLNIDMMSERRTKIIWFLFLAVVIFFYILTLAVPPAISTAVASYRDCPVDGPVNNDECLAFNVNSHPTFIGVLSGVNEYNNFFLLEMQPVRNESGGGYKTTDIGVSLSFNFTLNYVTSKSHVVQEVLLPEKNHLINFKCTRGQRLCESKMILYLPRIQRDAYQVIIKITNTDEVSWMVQDIQFRFIYMYQKYAQYLLILKYMFFFVSVIALLLYYKFLKKINPSDRIFEQKMLLVLSIALVLFNDPFFAVTLLYPSFLSALFSTVFVTSFYCLLLLFWLCQFERICTENDKKGTKTMKPWKVVLILVVWFTLVISYTILSYTYQQDPATNYESEDEGTYQIFKVFSILLVMIVVGVLVNYYVNFCRVWNTRIGRHKNFFFFSTYFIFCTFLFIFTGSLTVYNNDGNRVLIVISVTNMYIFFLQYFYGPSIEGIKESNEFQRYERER
eukprot:TRINITY_DN4669_c0_g1_i4.p1 TRINITY_DN4669_c0_g1~~TRINITY_DN4669_c0_g1_i4.p1  ORF type:complete len:464 (+),score=84.96 TRINITY_DN4669_c0_g1_i4:141-1532(+)